MAEEKNYLNHAKGIKSWLLTVDHKRIGVMYLISVLISLFLGGAMAILIRIQLLTPEGTLLSEDTYNSIFTLHGVIMIFMFIIPSIPAVLGNFCLPLMLGAKDVAFPKLNLASLYFYWIGAIVAVLAIASPLFGWSDIGLDTGWTFYMPYSGKSIGPIILGVLAAFIFGFSSILTGINFIVTIHKLRAPKLTWYKLPLFVWSLYATSILQVIATPVVGITLLLIVAERLLGVGIFDPSLGGDPILFQHFFWFYSHPAVYIMILPGMGVISELISTFSRKTIFGYKSIANSSIAIALVSFFVWGHHMFLSGQSVYSSALFSALTFLVAIPSAIKVFNWTATLYRGSIQLTTPMIYALSFLFLFTIGGLTGLPLATLTTDVLLHDSYFVVAHFHYVMFGGTLIAFLGGLHFWWSKMFGVKYNEKVGIISSLIIFFSFNLTFIPQFLLGNTGMPRRYASYILMEDGWQSLHVSSSIGAFILGFGFVLTFANLALSLINKEKETRKNPWGATTLEWESQTPPIHENFEGTISLTKDPYTY